MKAIKVLKDYRYDIKARAKLNGFEPILDEVNEALAELQDLESYIEERIRDSQPTARFRNSETVQAECRGSREAYADILQRIRGGEC